MKKDKKKLATIWVVLITIAATLIVGIGTLYLIHGIGVKNTQKKLGTTGITDYASLETYDMVDFNLTLSGTHNKELTAIDFDGLPIYEFEAVTTDGYTNVMNEYVGVLLKDFLYRFSISDYQVLTFKAAGGLSITYKAEEVDDNIFIIFERNGEPLDFVTNSIGIMDLTVLSRYNLDGLMEINVN